MKKLLIILGAVLISTATMNSQKISFEKERVNYGKIEYDSDGHREIVITNVGTQPLFIKDVVGQCGCTTAMEGGIPGWPIEPILPNGKGIIKFKYDTKREGRFDKLITIHSNDILGDRTFYIYGDVLPKKN